MQNNVPPTLTLVAGIDTSLDHHVVDLVRTELDIRLPEKWLAPHHAAQITPAIIPDHAQLKKLRTQLAPHRVDLLTAPRNFPRLLLADMDSTMITGETLDELAECIGIGPQVAAITARAMAGELNFRTALAERLTLIQGLPARKVIDHVNNITPSPGAKTLIRTLAAQGITCVLASGGFTVFTSAVADKLGFHHHHGNQLDTQNGIVTGRLVEPLIDRDSKRALLDHYVQTLGIPATATMTIGDGANDLPMLQAAGMGIGYRPKPLLQETLDNLILYADLTAPLYALGLTPDQFVTTP